MRQPTASKIRAVFRNFHFIFPNSDNILCYRSLYLILVFRVRKWSCPPFTTLGEDNSSSAPCTKFGYRNKNFTKKSLARILWGCSIGQIHKFLEAVGRWLSHFWIFSKIISIDPLSRSWICEIANHSNKCIFAVLFWKIKLWGSFPYKNPLKILLSKYRNEIEIEVSCGEKVKEYFC